VIAMTEMFYGEAIKEATIQVMREDKAVFLYGQGIHDPGAYGGSTEGIKDRFSEERCFDVPLSEDSLIGVGVGAAILGQRPIYVALRNDFLLLAMNQIVNHAAKWPLMSGYQSAVPLTIRAQIGKDWGQAAQHSGAYHSMFAGVPDLEVVLPSNVDDAARLFVTSVKSNRPTVFVEAKSLFEKKGDVELPIKQLGFGQAKIRRRGEDITLVAVSYMVDFAESVAKELERDGTRAELIDLRTISPLDENSIIESVNRTHRVAVFDVGWQKFGLASEIARVICMNSPELLTAPLVSIGQEWEHTPGGCFREFDHYPSLDKTVKRISTIL
jgi:pyruvate dehydrogenase E1 component beta subunit